MAPEEQEPRRSRRILHRDGALTAGPVHIQNGRAHHLRNVLRVRPGDVLVLFDGDGREAEGTVLEVGRSSVRLLLQEPRPCAKTPPACALTVAVSMPKPARADWLVEKLSELGVHRLLWVLCQHTDSTGRSRRSCRSASTEHRARMGRWQRVAQAAAAQCGRADLLRIDGPVDVDHLLSPDPLLAAATHSTLDPVDADARFVADAGGTNPVLLPAAELPRRSALLLVGPEGGLSRQELCKAGKAGYTCISLCPNILRVETAALVGAAVLLATADSQG